MAVECKNKWTPKDNPIENPDDYWWYDVPPGYDLFEWRLACAEVMGALKVFKAETDILSIEPWWIWAE